MTLRGSTSLSLPTTEGTFEDYVTLEQGTSSGLNDIGLTPWVLIVSEICYIND